MSVGVVLGWLAVDEFAGMDGFAVVISGCAAGLAVLGLFWVRRLCGSGFVWCGGIGSVVFGVGVDGVCCGFWFFVGWRNARSIWVFWW